MQKSLSIFKWYDNLWAAFIFFTRLPFWRLHQPPQSSYAAVVEWWPLTGWLTAGMMAATLYFGNMVLPYPIAILLAIVVRLLTTGALHEDGLADFFDGFGGGGSDRERILTIMKDSHIGTYGVIGLILYFAMLYTCLSLMMPKTAALVVFAGDAYSKLLAGQIIMFLPYARTEATSKAHNVYRKFSVKAGISIFLQGILPLCLLLYVTRYDLNLRWDLLVFIPCIVMYFLYYMMHRKIRGYTGDCCGALALLIELAFYLTVITLL